MMKKLLAAGVAASLSIAAQAALVTDWNYTVTSEFVPGSVQWRAGTAGGRSASASQVQWGPSTGSANLADAGSDRSGVAITGNPANGSIDTFIGTPVPPGDFTPPQAHIGLTQVFTHYNRVLSSTFSTLQSINVLTTLTLTPTNPAAPALPDLQAIFSVDFRETPNAGSGGVCLDGSLVSAPQNQPDGCGDIFVLIGSLDAAVIPYDGETYYVQIFEATGSLQPLSNAACAAAGASNGCIGFITRENQNTPVQFAFLISSEPFNRVPEPSSIALLGLGLGAAGYFVRRRRQAA